MLKENATPIQWKITGHKGQGIESEVCVGTMEFCFSSQGEDARLVLRCKMNQLPDQVPNWESQVSLQTASPFQLFNQPYTHLICVIQ